MKKTTLKFSFYTCLFLSSLFAQAARNNSYPIVLVHGFSGWGRDEMFKVKYWGGAQGDIQNVLNENGYNTYTAAVGPISSNWDRACELYAFIKGGRVDYGKAHSEKYGHSRYGRTFPGLLKQWNHQDKVHLIGHSQGGQTIRLLAQLLSNGSKEEITSTLPEELSHLFKGGLHWISSITTISTPHNGTTATDVVGEIPLVSAFLNLIAAMTGVSEGNFIYDFKLDQWGLVKKPEESFFDYKKRVFESEIWKSKDTALDDLSTKGAAKLNSWVKTQPNIYYFSTTSNNTKEEMLTGFHHPEINMIEFLKPFASIIGSFTRNQPNKVPIDPSWWPNDGLVPVTSGIGPTVKSKNLILKYNGKAQTGYWNYLGLHKSIDHVAIIGWGLYDPTHLMLSIAEKLGELPPR